MSPRKPDDERLKEAMDLVRKQQDEIRALTRELREQQREDDTAERIRGTIFNLATHSPDPPSWTLKGGGPGNKRGIPITVWSDWHWGEVVRANELSGINEFNTRIAAKRAQRLVDRTIDLAFHHVGSAKQTYPGIVVCLGGDMVGGDIHEELLATNDRTTHQSVNDLTDVVAAGIDNLASRFGRVFLPCVVGNHGRSSRKPRMKGRVFTNYDWSVYCNLERYFRKEKRIQFFIPSDADAHFRVWGRDYLLTHGDSIAGKGGDGIIGAIGPITRGIVKIINSEARAGRRVSHVIMGHHHQTLWLPNGIVNNALKGYDEYAHLQLRAPPSRPSQVLWFDHPEHGITSKWEVYLEDFAQAAVGARQEWVSWAA